MTSGNNTHKMQRSSSAMETVMDVFTSSSSSGGGGGGGGRSQETMIAACLYGGGILALSYYHFARRRHSRRILADKIDPVPRHGGDLVAEVLVKHKVQHLFALTGGHISPVLVAAKRRGLRVVDVRHEVNAVFAADAVSRLSNGVGVAVVTAGPGLTNVVTAVQNCLMAQSPMVLLGGATLGLLKHRGSLQDIDQQQIFKGCVKWQTSITRTRDIIPKLEEAFFRAMHGVPGPVFVELPLDVLYPEDRIRSDAMAKLEGKQGFAAALARKYLKFYFRRLYGKTGVQDEAPSIPWKPEPQIASQSSIDRAVRMIVKAEKPLLVVGSQAVVNRKDFLGDTYLYTLDTVVQSLRSLEIPAFLAGAARGCLGIDDDAKLHIRHKRSVALKQADLVVLLGVPCDFRLNYGLTLKSHTKVIAVNIDKKELYLNKRPHLAVHAEVPDFIVRLAQQLASQGDRKAWEEWRAQLQYECEKRDEEIQVQSQFKLPAVQDETHDKTVEVCNPISICLALNESLRTPSVLVCDGGDFIATAAQTVKPRNPQCWLDPGPFGTLGVGAGFALGAKLVRPYSDVWLLWGDGSAAYSIMEYDTFVRHGINVIGVIGNDACWRQIHRDQVQTFDDDIGCNLAFSDYHDVAKALGGQGYVVTNEDEMKSTIEKAYVDVKSKPVLINVLIGKTSFRDGSISI